LAEWQINEAKSRLSRLIRCAELEGPQIITRHGVESAVVVSIDEYKRLKAGQPDFRDYLLSGPKVDTLDIERSPDIGRDIEL